MIIIAGLRRFARIARTLMKIGLSLGIARIAPICVANLQCTAVAAIRLRMRMRILTCPENSLANFGHEISKGKLRINPLAIANGFANEIAKILFSLRKFRANGRLRQNSLALANAMAWCTQLRIAGPSKSCHFPCASDIECIKISPSSAVAAAILIAPSKIVRCLRPQDARFRLRSKIASEWRFSLRSNQAKLISTAETSSLRYPSLEWKFASEWRC